MELPANITAIIAQSPALALALFIWYYGNREFLRLLQERREMIEALRVEREQWVEELRLVAADYKTEVRQIAGEYKAELRAASETKIAIQAELHAIKGKVQELILKVELLLMRVGSGGNDDKPKSGPD